MIGEKNSDVARISCVIFDLDGTLTQTNPLIFASFNHVARRFLGTTLSPKEIISLFGPPEEGGLRKLLGGELAPAAMDELCDFYRSHHAQMAQLHDGVLEVLELLKQRNIPMALFTGKGKRTTRITLDEFGLSHYFDIVVTGDDVVQHKPHAEGILRVIGHCGVRAEEVLMVGDSLADLRASCDAGVRIAAAVWDSYDSDRVLAAGPDVVFSSVSEMFEWLDAHTNGSRNERPS